MMKNISIVVPVYNEEENLATFIAAIRDVMAKLDYEWQLIFVNDGSKDSTLSLLIDYSKNDSCVTYLDLARNYGHQIALTCGIDHAEGDAVITMDGDLQHPPELLPELINLWESGYDIVQTIRETTEGVSFVKNLTSKAYYRFLNLLAEKPVRPGGSDFRLMDRQAVLAMRQFREHSRFIRGLVSSLGFRQTTIHFTAPPRFAGVSKFSPRKMFHLAVDGILSQTIKPLRFAFWAGSLSALLCLCFIIYALVSYVEHHAVAGWTSMLAVLSFIGSLQLFLLGIIGEYLGHSFIEGRHRPLYLIRKPDPTRPDIIKK